MAESKTIDQSVIRKKVDSAIDLWNLFHSPEDKPPFRTPQLLIMALLHLGRPVEVGPIFLWIVKHFPYYRDHAAVASFLHDVRGPQAQNSKKEIVILKLELYDSIKSIDLPVEHTDSNRCSRGKFSCLPVEGNFLLNSFIKNPTGETSKVSEGFRFFDLPVELRNIIYEMVFYYPKSGLHVFNNGRNKSAISDTFKVYSRSHQEHFDVGLWKTSTGYGRTHRCQVSTRPLKDILAPLMTCRQFHNEAMPTFFRINHFHFDDPDDIFAFLRKIGPRRMKHFTHLSIILGRHESTTGLRGLRMLSKIDHLQQLDLQFNETRYFKETVVLNEPKGFEPVKDFSNFATVPELRRIKGLKEVNFCGPCPHLEQELKASMCEPKVVKKTVKRETKKRKANPEKSDDKQGRNSKKTRQGQTGQKLDDSDDGPLANPRKPVKINGRSRGD